MPIILASTSVYRKQLLQRLQIEFSCISPLTDETPIVDETAIDLVERLALLKAHAVAVNFPDTLVLGSDQSLLLDGQIIGKSGSVAAAIKQLQALSGREVVFETAVALVCINRDICLQRRVSSKVKFRDLSKTEISRYVEREMPLDCAGSFKAEALGISLLESIHSTDPTALIGLPLIATADILRLGGCQLP